MKQAFLSTLYFSLLFVSLSSCSQNVESKKSPTSTEKVNTDSLQLQQFYKSEDTLNSPSESIGTVGRGSLKNGKIFPFYGPNFTYFAQESYRSKRAYTSDAVRRIILNGYDQLLRAHPDRHFYLMELSHQKGGKLYPHHTHQNGLSADFMMPKLKSGKPDYTLDTIGLMHYFLTFDNEGRYEKDKNIAIDFNLVAEHIYILSQEAEKLGWAIEKVIIKLEYKDELFATPYGQKLKKKGIYFAQRLSKEVNDIHDDHFHVDFRKQ